MSPQYVNHISGCCLCFAFEVSLKCHVLWRLLCISKTICSLSEFLPVSTAIWYPASSLRDDLSSLSVLSSRCALWKRKGKRERKKKKSGSSLQCSLPLFNCAFIFQNIKISTYILWSCLLQGPLEGAGSMINHNYMYQSFLFWNMEYVLHSSYMNLQIRMQLLRGRPVWRAFPK